MPQRESNSKYFMSIDLTLKFLSLSLHMLLLVSVPKGSGQKLDLADAGLCIAL